MSSFHICVVNSDRALYLQGSLGHVRECSVANIQLFCTTEQIVSLLPDDKAFVRTYTLINLPHLMPDLRWIMTDS